MVLRKISTKFAAAALGVCCSIDRFFLHPGARPGACAALFTYFSHGNFFYDLKMKYKMQVICNHREAISILLTLA